MGTRCTWLYFFILNFLLINTFINTLPVYQKEYSSVILKDNKFENSKVPLVPDNVISKSDINKIVDIRTTVNSIQTRQNSQIRPGQTVRLYKINLTPDSGDTFRGQAVVEVIVTTATISNQLQFHVKDLNIRSVKIGSSNVNYNINGNNLRINPSIKYTNYILTIEWTGRYTKNGHGFHKGDVYGNGTYLAMNLHPMYARRVFPCVDEPSISSLIKFSFNDLSYDNLLSNAKFDGDNTNEFVSIQGAPNSFGMIAHDFININIPVTDVRLFTRPGILTQDQQASAAISFYFPHLNDWTNKNYFDLIADQDGRMNIVALPDISTDWRALSTIGIWEPHLLMQTTHSIKQRKTALVEIAKGMAAQWFGGIMTPDNWRFEWIISGLASYAGYDAMKSFQTDDTGNDITLLDVDALFVADVIQESLLQDAYPDSQPMETSSNIFDEEEIRVHVNGLLKFKAPAILRMLRHVLGVPEEDFIKLGARELLTIVYSASILEPVNNGHLFTAFTRIWSEHDNNNNKIDDIDEFLENWRSQIGYPVVHVSRSPGNIVVRPEPFSFGNDRSGNFFVPLTFTTSVNPDFNDLQPEIVSDNTRVLPINIGDDDWILFNIQGQGYYRVDYNPDLWENIIEALEDPERREVIHPLNRATLLDDSMNLARSGRISYDIPLRIVLTMEHETEYAVWKAYIRNMEFLRKRLVALVTVTEDDDLDEDIYVRMVRRTVNAIEDELGFQPETNLAEPAMDTLTRGMVMEHACKANHVPCIAAAVDWFFHPSEENTVNPNIPHELRPAVYCTMVKEGGEEIIEALLERLEIEPTLYEKVVILEALACSQVEDFINTLLQTTIAEDSPFSVEERNKIFAAVIESSYHNAFLALNFMSQHTGDMINSYGGFEKYEHLLLLLADNMAHEDHASQFRIWVNTVNNQLDDMGMIASRALQRVNQNVAWDVAHLEEVYDWINENAASTMILSLTALFMSLLVAFMNH